jgi:hypothetical protein
MRPGEQFRQIKIGRLVFRDSIDYMSGSLSEIVDSLEPEMLGPLQEGFGEKYIHLTAKLVYPYSAVPHQDTLDETTFWEQSEFYNDLTNTMVTDSEYQYAKFLYELFECNTRRDFTLIYVKTDVLFLACAFFAFRDFCMDELHLEPLRFLSTPAVAIEAAMLYSNAEIEYVSDPLIVQDIKQNIRGGNSQCSARYVNKKSLHEGGL